MSSSSAADLPPAASAGSAGSVALTGSAASLAPHYDVTSGIIELAEDGAQTGTEVVYFSDHGALETRDKTATLVLPGGAVTGVQHTVTVLRQDSIVVYNVATKSGSRIARSALADDLHGFGAGSVSLNPDSLQKLGAERVGQKTVAGLPCDVWRIASRQATACIHRGIGLESEVQTPTGKQHALATKVSLDVPVSAGKFELPPDVVIRDARSPAP